MSELSPAARALLESARRAPCAPDEAEIARMERAVLVATTGTLATLGGLKLASSSLAGKSAMAAVMLAVVGATAAVTVAVLPAGLGRARSGPQVTMVSAPGPVPTAPVVHVEPALAPQPEAPKAVEVPETLAPPRAAPRVERVRPAQMVKATVAPVPAAPPPPPPTSASSLAAELELLRTAKSELDAGRWEAALEAIARHDADFPEGVLRLEADVIRVLAWCGQGRLGEAMERAHQLRTKAPHSPAITRLAGSCVEL